MEETSSLTFRDEERLRISFRTRKNEQIEQDRKLCKNKHHNVNSQSRFDNLLLGDRPRSSTSLPPEPATCYDPEPGQSTC
jgi:hypothetical protein